jgi:hypothetical protein
VNVDGATLARIDGNQVLVGYSPSPVLVGAFQLRLS